MLEHIIKQFLFEQRRGNDYKAIVHAATKYTINAAKAAGGVFAFAVKIKLNKGVLVSSGDLRTIMSNTIVKNPTTGATAINATSEFANGKYIYLASDPLSEKSPGKKKFTVWVIERQKLIDVAVKAEDREKMTGYFHKEPSTNIDFAGIKIGDSPIMSYSDMAKWFSIITEAAKKQSITVTLPDIKKINKVETEINTGNYSPKIVDITDENGEDYPEISRNFTGKAEESWSTESGNRILTPIEGSTRIVKKKPAGVEGDDRHGVFVGTFSKGMPHTGTEVYYQLNNSGIYSKWNGEFTGNSYDDEDGELTWEVSPIPGIGEYEIKPHSNLTYPYKEQIPNRIGYTNTYYLDGTTGNYSDPVYFINMFTNIPEWYYTTKIQFEVWIESKKIDKKEVPPTTVELASPDKISSLNKMYPNALSDAIKYMADKRTVPVQFIGFPEKVYLYTEKGTEFVITGDYITKQPSKPQYWHSEQLSSSEASAEEISYSKLLPSTKELSSAYWVKTNQIK